MTVGFLLGTSGFTSSCSRLAGRGVRGDEVTVEGLRRRIRAIEAIDVYKKQEQRGRAATAATAPVAAAATAATSRAYSAAAAASAGQSVETETRRCRAWRDEGKVKMGVSWGILPTSLQKLWRAKGCDAVLTKNPQMDAYRARIAANEAPTAPTKSPPATPSATKLRTSGASAADIPVGVLVPRSMDLPVTVVVASLEPSPTAEAQAAASAVATNAAVGAAAAKVTLDAATAKAVAGADAKAVADAAESKAAADAKTAPVPLSVSLRAPSAEPTVVAADLASPVGLLVPSPSDSSLSYGPERAKDIVQCRLWRSEYEVEVMVSWGTLPAPLQTSWGSKGCDGLSRSEAELSVILAGAAGAGEVAGGVAGAAGVPCSDNFVVTLGVNIASPALTSSSVFDGVANVGLCCAKCQANEECYSFVLGPDRRCMLKYMTNKPDTSPRHSGMVSFGLCI